MLMADNYSNTNVPGATFGSQDSSMSSLYAHESNFEVSSFFEFSDWMEENPAFSSTPAGYNPQTPIFTSDETVVNTSGISSSSFHDEGIMNRDSESSKEKKEVRVKVAFKTKSEIEILDDGFKWRKYGKKMVKNSPNPRNYYKCSVEGCSVKKRVERDNDDPHYVVTTYEGIHNHQGPQI